jgi:hypothetical protein
VSDIDTAVVDSLKVLDPKRPIREADIAGFPRRANIESREGFSQAAHQIGEPLQGVDPNSHCSRQKYGRRVEFRSRYRGFQPGRPAEFHSFEHAEVLSHTLSKNFSRAASMGPEIF